MGEVKLIVLSGLPACGKSTLCQELARRHCFPSSHLLVVCFDDFISESDLKVGQAALLHAGAADIVTWRARRHEIYLAVDWLLRALSGAERVAACPGVDGFLDRVAQQSRCLCLKSPGNARCSHIVVLDDNMYYSSMRFPYFALARQMSVAFGQLYLHVSDQVAGERNRERQSSVTESTIAHMCSKMEVPGAKAWETCCCVIDSTQSRSDIVSAAVRFIDTATVPPALPDPVLKLMEKMDNQAITKSSVQHQIDQVLRKCVSAKMKSLPGGANARLAGQQLNGCRRELLERIKTGRLSVGQMMDEVEVGAVQHHGNSSQEEIVDTILPNLVQAYFDNLTSDIVQTSQPHTAQPH